MNQYIEVFNRYLSEHPMQLGHCDMESLLGMLYCCYHQRQRGDGNTVSSYLERLDNVLDMLALEEQDHVINLTCELCAVYQREAFEEGLVAGFRLFKELTECNET